MATNLNHNIRFMFALTLILISARVTKALEPDVVVKISSKLCTSQEKIFNGSGILFSSGSDKYVVTSDHVVLNGKDGFCHKAWNTENGDMTLSPIAFDWGKGLALFKVSKFKGNIFPASKDELFKETQDRNARVQALGYPAESTSLTSDDRGRFTTLRSARHLFASLNYVHEIVGLHGEFGMSGGALASPFENKIYGMLSHQALIMAKGKASKVADLSQTMQESESLDSVNTLFVIPSGAILNFINDNLKFNSSGRLAESIYKMDPIDQMQGKQTISISGISFKLNTCDQTSCEQASPQITLAMNSLGGGDPIGIGGSNSDDFSRSIVVEPKDLSSLEQSNSVKNLSWFKSLSQALKLKQSVTIPFLIQTDLETLEIRKIGIHSLAGFMKSLESGEAVPLMLVQNPTLAQKNIQDLSTKSVPLADSMIALVEPKDPEFLVASSQLKLILNIASSGNGILIETKILDRLLDNSKLWNPMFLKDVENTTELMINLKRIRDILNKIKLQ